MTQQERKDKVDIITKRGDLIYKKLLLLIAIAGGSWLYGVSKIDILSYFAIFAFFLSSIRCSCQFGSTWASYHKN